MYLFLDKPKGISSFKFLYDVKKANPGQKVGHAGTLDPMATGLMIVAVGRESTKQLSSYVGLDKRYNATIDLSLYTDTWDDEYWDIRQVLEYDNEKVELLGGNKRDASGPQHDKDTNKGDTSHLEQSRQHEQETVSSVILTKEGSPFRFVPTLPEITSILDSLIGEPELPIPAFSAKKVAGKKLYDLARQGEDLQRVGKMKIFEYSIIDYSFPLLKIQIHVGSGTYVRSIGRWIGMQLGLGGSLIALRRTKIGEYSL